MIWFDLILFKKTIEIINRNEPHNLKNNLTTFETNTIFIILNLVRFNYFLFERSEFKGRQSYSRLL